MSNTANQFPPIPELDSQPFMSKVQNFARVRQEGIEMFRDRILEMLNELPGFTDVPDDAKTYLALRTGTFVQRLYEMGIQEGVEFQRDVDEAQRREDHRFRRNMIEAVAGR